MRVGAVICEYNPLHGGHIAMLREIRALTGEDAAILCLMSGDFVQRGEPAVMNKFERAGAALENGADLVLELPYPFSASVSEHFAAGAVSILSSLGVEGELFFGCERPEPARLREISSGLYSEEFAALTARERKNMRALSYPRLISHCWRIWKGEELDLLPNEILAVSYLRELGARNARLEAHALPIVPGFSASEIRKEMSLHPERYGGNLAFWENGWRAVQGALLTGADPSDRFARAAQRAASFEELLTIARRPTDTDARLKRELLSVLLSSDGKEKYAPRFTVLLGANGRGKKLLAQMKKSAKIEIVTKQAHPPLDPDGARQFALYLKAERFYSVFTARGTPPDRLFKTPPRIVP